MKFYVIDIDLVTFLLLHPLISIDFEHEFHCMTTPSHRMYGGHRIILMASHTFCMGRCGHAMESMFKVN